MAFLGASLRIHPTLCNTTTDFPAKSRLRNKLLIGRSAIFNLVSLVTRHQYGVSAVVPQKSFHGETGGSVAKYRLFSQTIIGA